MSEPRCPGCGGLMEELHLAAGSWRYACPFCATIKNSSRTRGWASPIRSTKERAKEAACLRKMQKPLTIKEAKLAGSLWIEHRYIKELFPAVSLVDPKSDDFDIVTIKYGGSLDMCVVTKLAKLLCGKAWRPWATKPTDAEREATEWWV